MNRDKSSIFGNSTRSDEDYDLEKGGRTILSNDELRILTVIDCNIQERLAFIRKVYTILSAQLIVTFGFVLVGTFSPTVKAFLQANTALLWVALVLSLVFVIILACVPGAAVSYPGNFVLLACFTVVEGYVLAAVSSVYETTSVVQAVAITIAITVGLTLYTFQSKHDFSAWGSVLFVLLMVFVFGGFMRLFLPSSPVLDTVWAGLGALLFSAYIVYDTFLLLHKLGPNDYIAAALSIYLDIINLFIYILQIIGKRD